MRNVVTLTVIGLCFLCLPTVQAGAKTAIPVAAITINGNGGGRTYAGVGAILGGGGNARYLADYPTAERTSILNYLFKPGYGAALQILKLEIGGDGNSSDGSEPSIEHTRGQINCNSGYELAIARQAVTINPDLKLYALQWGGPSWVGENGSLFTTADIGYLLDWLSCARRQGLTISYLGGWNEHDNGSHASWYGRLRQALNANGYRGVQIVAGDSLNANAWEYAASPAVSVLGAHDNCGYPTGVAGAQTRCTTTAAARASGKPLWASELGAMDRGAQKGCVTPCAPTMDRAFIREYLDARVTGVLEWPAIDSMPATVLPYENRGLLTADQPWSGHYQVNAMTWAIAQVTQFAFPPTPAHPGGWKYLDSASGYLRGNRANGSYVTLIRSSRDQWSTIIETTAGVTQIQRAKFTVKGGHGLSSRTVHVWSSNFSPTTSGPARWFVRQPDIHPVNGKFTLTVKPGYVYSLTTTSGQGKGKATSPGARPLNLPYTNRLATGAGEPSGLAAEDGSFELAPCRPQRGQIFTCTEQTAVDSPVRWHGSTWPRQPYAIIGSDWRNYTVTVSVRLLQPGSAGLIGRYRAVSPATGTFDGYVFDVNTAGTYTLTRENGGLSANGRSRQRHIRPTKVKTLTAGAVAFEVGRWHTLTLSMSGAKITAAIDGTEVAAVINTAVSAGMPGIEVGGWYPAYFANLVIR